MRRKVLGLLLVVVLTLAFLVNGCGILTVNEERDMARSVSTVTYGGLTANVTKGELMEYFVTYADTYMNYYGMTAEEVLEFSMKQLNTRKLLVLYAEKEYNITPSLSGLGTEAYNEAVIKANDLYQQTWESYIKSVKEDRETASPSDSASPSESATIRPTPVVTPEDEDAYVSENDWETDANGIVIPFYEIEELVASDDAEKSVKNAALKQLWKAFENNYKPQEYYLTEELEQKVIDLLLDRIHESLEVTPEMIEEEYARLCAEQKNSISDDETYRSSLESGDSVYFVKENEDGTYGGYGYVKNLLISFDSDAIANGEEIDGLVAEYNRMKSSGVYSETVLQNKLAEIVSKLKIKNYGTAGYYDGEGLARDREGSEDQTASSESLVLGNVVYDDGRFVLGAGNDLSGTFYSEVLAEIGTDVPAITDNDTAKARINKFVNYIFGYGEDTGMFNNEVDYLVSPEGNSWYEDFTTVSQELIKNVEEGTGNDIGWSVTPYGVHVVMVTYVPVLRANGDKYLTLDTVLNVVTGKTVRDVIRDKLSAANDAATENSFTKDIINQYENSFVIHEDVYNSIIEG